RNLGGDTGRQVTHRQRLRHGCTNPGEEPCWSGLTLFGLDALHDGLLLLRRQIDLCRRGNSSTSEEYGCDCAMISTPTHDVSPVCPRRFLLTCVVTGCSIKKRRPAPRQIQFSLS